MQTKKRLAKGNLADILPSVECLWQHRWTSSVCRLIPFVTCSKASGVGRWNGSRSHCQLKTLQGAPFTTDCSSLVRQFRFFVFMILSYLSLCFCVLCFVFFFEKFCWLPMHKGLRETHWAAGLGPQIQIQIVNEQNFKTYLFTMHRSPGTTMVYKDLGPKRTSALAHWGRTMASSRQLPDTNRRRRAA